MRKILLLAVFGLVSAVALPPSSAAQNLSDRDWRSFTTVRTVERIERWEELFANAQASVAALNGVGIFGDSTLPFTAIPAGRPVFEFENSWAGTRRCRTVYANPRIVIAYDWFQCRVFRADGQWRIRKVTGSVRFEAWLFRDPALGTVAVGDEWVEGEPRTSHLARRTGVPEFSALLRHDSAKTLRLFQPYLEAHKLIEIDLGR
jgi:Domain of unknown function (DUF4893)